MTYEGDSVWSMEFIIEDYFSDLNLVQDTSMGSDSSVVFQDGLIPYTIGVVFRDKMDFTQVETMVVMIFLLPD